ncbi:HAMP domain-containing sensor histidine kinase [Curtobacterium sp. VKM Ac-2922]|uniref:sensor histidine kinase n=1 Tax=Curtobacterium sp. VKM Ac-2922 TaxID=2929475 RepID=UPI001FB3D3C1|nr:HAMP domain-containing sensor histidine kinase [Curtobacterium sp. VKM Ac-2922]MCJ1714921.1 HAMP domain-containing histidine kinase [Curtobacterium sp. VKM Ac-2922]
MTTWTSGPVAPAARPVITTRVAWYRSLRVRTATAMALLALTLVLAAGAVFAHTSITGAREQLRAQAVAQLRETAATDAFGGALPSRATSDPAALPGPLRRALTGDQVVTYDDGDAMWAARGQGDDLLATRVSAAPVRQQWNALVETFAVSGAAAALIAAVASWFVAGRLTGRLRRTASTVNDAIGGRQAAPAATAEDDEVGVLSRGIADTAAALAARLERERAVSADVAHDLKTPLTALSSAAALLGDDEDAARIRRLVRRLRDLVDDLLRLAQAQHDTPAVQVRPTSMAGAVEQVLEDQATGDVPLRVLADATVPLDADRLARALTNLVQNARQHGGGHVVVEVDGHEVRVVDDGPGFPEAILRDGPRRFGALGTAGGTGIGLAIALHHAEAMGARLVLSTTDGGACAALRFG